MFTTFEIGSLAKPLWRTKPFSGIPIEDEDIKNAQQWGKFLKVETEELITILVKRKNFTSEDKKKIISYSSLYAIRLLEKAGLDWVFDGEQHRIEMYQYPLKYCEGFKLVGEVRSFDNKYYKKAAIVSPVRLKSPYHLEEFMEVKRFARKPVKIPITGPYTLCDWSYDEYYTNVYSLGRISSVENRKEGRKKLLEDVAFNIIKKNIEVLVENGAQWIQIDEPALTTHPDEVDLGIEVIGKIVESVNCKVSIHICFSSYENLFPHIEKLENKVTLFALEFANRDTPVLGINSENRIGYEILKRFKPYNFSIGVGVLDIHSDFIESPQLIRDRILWALKILENPERISVSPDCGLRTRSWEVAYQKLSNMVEGVNLARKLI